MFGKKTCTVTPLMNVLHLTSIMCLQSFESFTLKARTHRDEFHLRYSTKFNASWLNKGRQCECAHRREKRHA